MEYSELHISNLEDIIKEAGEIASKWNGDESGKQEERAQEAEDIIKSCKAIIESINYLNEN